MTTAENSWSSLSAQAERLCDAFETRWKGRERPSLEEFLAQAPEAERPALLYELLLVEWEYRQKKGEPVAREEYAARFADQADVVEKAGAVFERRERLNQAGPKPNEATVRTLVPDATAAFAGSDAKAPPEPLVVGSVSIPRRLGEYELLEELGIGGMGIVFRARQRRAARIVALKLVRPDKLTELTAADRETVLARFRQEAEAAARLQHDHAVTVYEVGCAEGFHFYSMRLVEGESLAELLQRGPLDPVAAAEMLEGVAQAVAEGHRLNIVHRDLKPRNILLEKKSGRALVTDFGLAKLTETESDLTRTGEVFGSPPYMAPEQAVSAANVTSAADTYALGATLYHALTGRPPFQAATVLQTLRQVVEEEPVSPRSLNRAVPRDLETICLKCLEKEPERRYASTGELADELRAFRAGEPIKARPAGAVDRAWRWCRRNPLSATLAVAAALLLCGVFVAIGVGYITTAQALKRERTEHERANAERDKARENLLLAFRSVDLFFSDLSEKPQLKAHGLEKLRHELLGAATGFFDLMVQQGNDPHISWERARAYGRLAHIGGELRERKEAAGFYQQAISILDQLEAAAAAGGAAKGGANTSGDEAGPALVEVRELKALYLGHLGSLELETPELPDAALHLYQAESLSRELKTEHPERFDSVFAFAESRFRVAELKLKRGEAEAARKAYEETSALCEQLRTKHPARLEASELLGKSQTNLALLDRRGKRMPAAIELSAAALATYERLLRQAPENGSYQALLGLAEMNLGAYQRADGKFAEAEQTLRRALARFETLVKEHPDVPDFRAKLAATRSNLASTLQDLQKPDDAEPLYRQAMTALGELVVTFPDDGEYQSYLDAAWNNFGTLLEQKGDAAAAEQAYRHASDTFARLVALEPENPAHAARLAGTHANYGRSLAQQGRAAEAAAELYEAAQGWSALAKKYPNEPAFLEACAKAFARFAESREELHAFELAEAAWTEAIRYQDRFNNRPGNEFAEDNGELGTYHAALAQLFDDQKKYRLAAENWGQAAGRVTEDESTKMMAHGAVSLALAGDRAGAQHTLAVIGEYGNTSKASAETSLHLARAWSAQAQAARNDRSLAEAERELEAKRCLVAAWQGLDNAAAGGAFKEADARRRLLDDPAFAPLRDTSEFREWAKNHGMEK